MRWIRAKSNRAVTARAPARRALALLFKGFFFSGGLTACGDELAAPVPAAHPEDPTPRRGGTLRLASIGDVRSLDPATVSDGLAASVLELLFAGLVDYDDAGNPVPDLAERWEVDAGGKAYRFFLRKGVLMHDGEELTADDVKRSVERALHPATPNPYASAFENIAGFAEYTEKNAPHLEGVVVEGRYVVTFRLAAPDAAFLPLMGLMALRPVCKTAGDRFSDAWAPCGAGPFRLPAGGWERGRSTTVARFDGYFRPGLPHLDAVSWEWNVNVVSERLKLERGELDALREFTQADLVRYRADPRWSRFGWFEPDRTIFAQGMNVELAPFDNVEVRRAVAAVIDRDKLCMIKPSALSPAYQLLPPSVPGYHEGAAAQRHDRAAALEHMRRAGYPFDPATRTGGYPNVIPYYVYRQGMGSFAAQILQQDLADIGLRLELRMMSYPSWLALSRRRGKVALTETGWTMDYPDPSNFFDSLFSTRAINDDDSNNTSFYRNPRLDELLRRARRELDPGARERLYEEANAILRDDAPWAFTYRARSYSVRQPYVRDLRAHPVWLQQVSGVWLDRENERRAARAGGRWRSVTASVFGATP
jgi:ABC-type transport system substrate-binding protein